MKPRHPMEMPVQWEDRDAWWQSTMTRPRPLARRYGHSIDSMHPLTDVRPPVTQMLGRTMRWWYEHGEEAWTHRRRAHRILAAHPSWRGPWRDDRLEVHERNWTTRSPRIPWGYFHRPDVRQRMGFVPKEDA